VRAPSATLRVALAEAEQRLNDNPPGTPANAWGRLREAVGNEQACASAVNALLAALLGGWLLIAPEEGRWWVTLLPAAHVQVSELAAAQALVLVIESGGWSRLRRCNGPGCDRVFLDFTSGGNRRGCRTHARSP
jgi:predicted RNA-binding Zn ribbon-like protein